MILLYTLLLLFLGLIKFLVDRRANYLAWRYGAVARNVDNVLRETTFKDGNSSKFNPCKAAQRQLILGLLVQKKEKLESKHFTWTGISEKLGRVIDRLRNWKGQKLPYTMGALDVWLILYLIDHLGVSDHFSAHRLIESVVTSLTQ